MNSRNAICSIVAARRVRAARLRFIDPLCVPANTEPSTEVEGSMFVGLSRKSAGAFDNYRFQHDGRFGLVLSSARNERDFVRDLLSLNDFAEDGVVAGEPWRGSHGDKELAAIGSGSGVGHGQLAGLVKLVRRALGLVLEAVTGSAHAGARRVATLNHEVGNDAMEDGAIEELVGGLLVGRGMGPLLGALGQLDKVLDGDGRVGLEEADGDLAFGGREDGVGSCCESHEYLLNLCALHQRFTV